MKISLGSNTYAMPTPVWIIATYDDEGKANAMAASWAGVCSSQPPCVSVALRKATYTYGALNARKAFTVNIPDEQHIREADYFGVATGRTTDKFADCGLTPVRSELVDAPYIAQFPLILECRLIFSHVIDLHTVFIGEIVDAKADESVLNKKGRPDFEKVKPFLFDPCSGDYFACGGRLRDAFVVGSKEKLRDK